jgi:hypothetical protein
MAVDLALSGDDNERRRDVELTLVTTAKPPDTHTLSLRQTVPGIGKIRSLVLRYDIQTSARCPRVQAYASDGRLVTWAEASGGKRHGPSGTNIGHAPRTWAFSEAAVFCLRAHPAGHKLRARLANQHGQGKALTIVAHQLARAVYDMVQRQTAFHLHTFCSRSGRGVGALDASRDNPGMTLTGHARALVTPCVAERP